MKEGNEPSLNDHEDERIRGGEMSREDATVVNGEKWYEFSIQSSSGGKKELNVT